jgi:mono/diheme cytochrome c family protein
MLRRLVIVAAVALVAVLGAFWLLTMPSSISAAALPPRTANVDNGRTMFLIGGCASCHATPKQEDRTRLGGGLALRTPFGTFYPPNISPDPTEGIGGWSEAQFVTALTHGTSPEGEHYFPAFPYTSYRLMHTDDIRDLFAYLKTAPAVADKSRPHDVRFPFNIRRAVGIWKLLYLRDAPIAEDGAQSAAWNRGNYLVNGPGHCAECHSPRDMLGGIKSKLRFTGGPDPEGKGKVPDITAAKLKDWSDKDVAEVLASGMTPDGDSVGGSMAEVVRNTAELSPAERAAIAVYVKSLPAR